MRSAATHVARSVVYVSLCRLGTPVISEKMDEPIEMTFEARTRGTTITMY